MKTLVPATLAIFFLLAACSQQSVVTRRIPTETPTLTLVAEATQSAPTQPPPTVAPTQTASATLPPTSTPTPAPPTATLPPPDTATPTAAPAVPPAEIEMTAPGALSKVISPIPIRALLVPGDLGRVTVELLGEDGRVITRQIVLLNPDLGRKAGLVIDLPFEIPVEAELGRLAIYRQDAFGRTTALSSRELVLLSSGQADYNAVVDRSAPVVIQEPVSGTIIQGERVLVTGIARPDSPLDLVAELITETGQIVGQRVFAANPSEPGTHTPFAVEIPFTVSEPTWVLLIIRERGERIPGITYLVSTEILLSP